MEENKGDSSKFMDRRGINIAISAVLFVTNFLLIYFVCMGAYPAVTGIARLALVWVGAYAMTYFMSQVTRGLARLILSLVLLGVLYVVFMYRPGGIPG